MTRNLPTIMNDCSMRLRDFKSEYHILKFVSKKGDIRKFQLIDIKVQPVLRNTDLLIFDVKLI